MRRFVVAAVTVMGLVVGTARAAPEVAAAQPEKHVRGVVAAVEGDHLEIKVPGGKKTTVRLADDVRLSLASKSSLAGIGQGLFIGTTAVAQPDGTLRALEVHLFPESMRGAGEGHRPWDLKPGSSMTNATASQVESAKAAAPSSMTNATVSNLARSDSGLKVVLEYPEGEKTIFVPPSVPVVKLEPTDRAHLTVGAHVFAAGPLRSDGTVLVKRMVIGEGTLRPPM